MAPARREANLKALLSTLYRPPSGLQVFTSLVQRAICSSKEGCMHTARAHTPLAHECVKGCWQDEPLEGLIKAHGQVRSDREQAGRQRQDERGRHEEGGAEEVALPGAKRGYTSQACYCVQGTRHTTLGIG